MKTKKFTFLQLLNVIEGRVSTKNSVDDCQEILSHLFNTSVMTPEVGAYISKLGKYNPIWLAALRVEIKTLKLIHLTKTSIWDFRSERKRYADMVVMIGREMNFYFDIPQLKEFADKP